MKPRFFRANLLMLLFTLTATGCPVLDFLTSPAALPFYGATAAGVVREVQRNNDPPPPPPAPCALTLSVNILDAECDAFLVAVNPPLTGVYDLLVNGRLIGTVTHSDPGSLLLTDADGLRDGINVLEIRGRGTSTCTASATVMLPDCP